MSQTRTPAVYMRGGTSKGVFFLSQDLPTDPRQRDDLLLRVIGSPDRYGKHIDGMGGATSSTSKVVIVAPSSRPDCDVDYLFGAVSVVQPVIDWSGNCGNLSAAVGPFAIHTGLIAAPADGMATVRIWQANVGRRILAHVPMRNGDVQETGDFDLDGVSFPGAEIRLEFLDPAAAEQLFPAGNPMDTLSVPGIGSIAATLIDAGNPTIFIDAGVLGLTGTELPSLVNQDADLLARAEVIRATGAVAMGLAGSIEEASALRPHTPKLAFVSPPADYVASDGRPVARDAIHLVARIFSMGQLHHAMTGTGAVALAAAAAIPGTVVHEVSTPVKNGPLCFGHPSGVLQVGAETRTAGNRWIIDRVIMSRSARILMEGWVRTPTAS